MNTQCRPAARRRRARHELSLALLLTAVALTPTPVRGQSSATPPPASSPSVAGTGAPAGPSPTPSPASSLPPPLPAAAEAELPIDVAWSAPEGCPDVEALKWEVRRVAGEIPPSTERPEARAVVRRGRAPSWQLTLTTKAGATTGERRLTASDCAELMRATALVLALMINPHAGIPAPPPEPVPPPPVAVVAPPPPPPPKRVLRLATGVDLLAGTGILPDVATGFGLRLAAGGDRFFAQLRAGYWLAQSAFITGRPEAGGSFDALDVGGAGCARLRPDRRVSPAVCAGLLAIRSHGSGLGVSAPSEASAWWSAALLEAQVRISIGGHHALRIGLEGALPLGRPPTFALRGIGPVFQPSASAARGILGWEVYF